MKKLFVFILLSANTLLPNVQSREALYFGIMDNHRPHVYLNTEEQPSGTLIDYINTLCKALDSECNFAEGNLFNHLEELQSGQLNALLITDSVLLPTTDDIIFTPPLCTIQPVFIYNVRQGEPDFKSVDEIKNVTIGVHLNSSSHIYLLENFYNHSHIKPYPLLESGVFDLANNRIDTLFAERSFFEAQVATTTLVSKKKNNYLDILTEKIELPFKTMSLALRANDRELYDKLSKLITANGPTESCTDLVRKKLEADNSAESSTEASANESPEQGNKAK